MTRKSEHDYRAALDRLTVALSEASKAAHALVPTNKEVADIERTMSLEFLTETAAQLCPAQAQLLKHIADALFEVAHPDDDRAETSEEAPTPSGRTEH
jgi:hypothetical protein